MNTYAGGVCNENLSFVDGLSRGVPGTACAGDVNAAYEPDKVSVFDETVIYGGLVHGRFGHFMLEGMSRFWYILSNESNHRICFLTYDNKPSKAKWFWEFMDLLHIDRERVFFVEKACKFAKVIVPEESMHAWGRFFTKEYILPYRYINSQLKPFCYKKIYLARGGGNTGAAYVNERYFQEFYSRKGFVALTPEMFSLPEQISLIAGAEEVATTMGTLSHFALFCKPGTKFTILTRTDDTVLTPQLLVNEASGIDCTIITGTYNFLSGHRYLGPVLFAPTEYFRKYVLEVYGEEIETASEISPFGEYLKAWCRYYLEEGHIADLQDRSIEAVMKRLCRVAGHGELAKKTGDILRSWGKGQESRSEYINHIQRELLDSILLRYGADNQCPMLLVDAHVARVGWIDRLPCGLLAGDIFHTLEAIRIYDEQRKLGLRYRTYTVQGGWSNEAGNGEMSGSVGRRCPLSGIAIVLGSRDKWSVYYRVKWSSGLWSMWHRDGEEIISNEEKVVGIEVELK